MHMGPPWGRGGEEKVLRRGCKFLQKDMEQWDFKMLGEEGREVIRRERLYWDDVA